MGARMAVGLLLAASGALAQTPEVASGSEQATRWTAGAATPIAVSSPVTAIAIGRWEGAPAIYVGTEDGVGVRTGPAWKEVAALALPVVDLHPADLDGDGVIELIACGPSGLHALRADAASFSEPIGLSATACGGVASYTVPANPPVPALDHLIGVVGQGARAWTPGGGGLVMSELDVPAGPHGMAVAGNGERWAAVGASLVVGGPGERTQTALGGPFVGLAPDGEGFAFALGGAAPRLVSGSGTRVPLPGEPRGLHAVDLGGPGLLVALPERSVALRLGSDDLVVTALPAAADHVASGELTGDGCDDLVVFPADGADGVLLAGVCPGALAVAAAPEPAGVDAPAVPDGVDLMSGELKLGREWAQLTVQVGQSARVQLVDADYGWQGFERKGGPDAVRIDPNGLLSFTPTDADVGIWRVSVRLTDGTGERWSGIVLRVRGDAGAQPVRVDPEPTLVVEDPGDRNNVVARSRRTSPFGFRECLASAGVAAGLSKNSQQAWSNVGLPDAVPSVSPAVTVVCGGGAPKVHWMIGVDSAPTFFYLAENGRMNHLLAGTFGVEWRPGAVRVGPFVNAGVLVFGVGLRTVIVPFQTRRGGRHGMELRLTGYPANLSGQVIAGYTWEFGDF